LYSEKKQYIVMHPSPYHFMASFKMADCVLGGALTLLTHVQIS